MRRRIYWLLPDLESAKRTMDDLLLARIAEQHMHFVAREDVDLSGLHPANVLQTSDVVRAAQVGLLIGGAIGAVLGVAAAVFFPIVGDKPQWGIAAVLAVLGGAFGASVAGVIGGFPPRPPAERVGAPHPHGAGPAVVDVAPPARGRVRKRPPSPPPVA